jgi:CTP:molybdopterin cytidylyltransferase MocA
MKIHALILAAGAGRRLGGPKALLDWRGRTFLAHAARLCARPGIERVLAVVGHEADRVRREAGAGGLELVENPDHASGMLSSVLFGLSHAERHGAEAVLLHPVDHPAVDPRTLDAVIAALRDGARLAVPSFENRRGHPAGFARAAWDALRAAPPDEGARAVLARHPEWIVHVPGDAGCVSGANTPEEYERLVAAAETRYSAPRDDPKE